MSDKPIHPADIQPEHYCLAAFYDMVESWRGLPRNQVPVEVRMIAWMFRELETSLHEIERLDKYMQAMESELTREHRATLKKLGNLREQMGIVNLPLHALKDHVQKEDEGRKAPRLVRDAG